MEISFLENRKVKRSPLPIFARFGHTATMEQPTVVLELSFPLFAIATRMIQRIFLSPLVVSQKPRNELFRNRLSFL